MHDHSVDVGYFRAAVVGEMFEGLDFQSRIRNRLRAQLGWAR